MLTAAGDVSLLMWWERASQTLIRLIWHIRNKSCCDATCSWLSYVSSPLLLSLWSREVLSNWRQRGYEFLPSFAKSWFLPQCASITCHFYTSTLGGCCFFFLKRFLKQLIKSRFVDLAAQRRSDVSKQATWIEASSGLFPPATDNAKGTRISVSHNWGLAVSSLTCRLSGSLRWYVGDKYSVWVVALRLCCGVSH